MMFAGDGPGIDSARCGLHPAHALVERWRSDAERLSEHYGQDHLARLLSRMAGDLEVALCKWGDETLNLREAAQESGYSEDHLGRLIMEGKVPNAGRKHAPRIRRADLPEKQGRRAPSKSASYDKERLFQDIVASKFGG